MFTGHDRRYTIPPRLVADGGSAQVDVWALLEMSAQLGDLGEWADGVIDGLLAKMSTEGSEALDCDGDCEDLGYYGIADADNEDLLTELVREAPDGSYEKLTAAGWAPFVPDADTPAEILDVEAAMDLATVIASGGDGLMLRFAYPKAWLPPTNEALQLPVTAAAEAAEEGWKNYAIVDELDPGAVLDLIRLRKGPELEAYREASWVPDPDILTDLQGVSPPMLVEVKDSLLASVMKQIEEFESVAGGTVAAVSPDPRAEKLRRYWSRGGKGGMKIRWGTKGDWRRCVRQLAKYMGPRAKGYCQNLHKRNTGVYTGSKLNASATWPTMSTEAALAAAIAAGAFAPDRKEIEMYDGIYIEKLEEDSDIMNAITAGAFPVSPPDEWLDDPKLTGPTPLTVDNEGRVFGHIATFDMAHIGLPGKVHAPKSKSNYAFFHTGELVTASGASVSVGQLTLAGGHAPLHADAGQAAAHYDNTASAVADVRVGEDKFGIWAAGALRPDITPEQVRALRASAPSGDWRPINGNLELVAVCQVNVPGFPTTRARVASGAVMALVAAGARPLAEQRFAEMADSALAKKVSTLEAALVAAGVMAAGEGGTEALFDEGTESPAAPAEDAPAEEAAPASPEPAVEAEEAEVVPESPATPAEAPAEASAEEEKKEEEPAAPAISDRLQAIRDELKNRKRDALRARVASGKAAVSGDEGPKA